MKRVVEDELFKDKENVAFPRKEGKVGNDRKKKKQLAMESNRNNQALKIKNAREENKKKKY